MNIRSLTYFIAIVEEGSITAAADRLFITQPALSRILKDIENEVGCQLFDREKSSLILNETGKVFLKHARIVVHEMEQLMVAVTKQRKLEKTYNLHIGTFSTLVLESFLSCFLKSTPNCRCYISEYHDSDCLKKLQDHDCDCFITYTPPEKNTLKYLLMHDRIYVSIPAGTAYYDAKSITLEELAELPVIASSEPLSPTDAWTQKFVSLEKHMFKDLVITNRQTALAFGYTGEKCILITGSYLTTHPLESGRKVIPLNHPMAERYVYLCYLRENTEKLRPLLDCIEQNKQKIFSLQKANELPIEYSLLY